MRALRYMLLGVLLFLSAGCGGTGSGSTAQTPSTTGTLNMVFTRGPSPQAAPHHFAISAAANAIQVTIDTLSGTQVFFQDFSFSNTLKVTIPGLPAGSLSLTVQAVEISSANPQGVPLDIFQTQFTISPGLTTNVSATLTPIGTLHQFVYLATTTGIDVFSVDGSGSLASVPADNVASANVLGLAVAQTGGFLVAAVNTGTAATSGMQLFTIDSSTGALAPLGGVAVGLHPPAGQLALDPAGVAGAFADTGHDVEGFTINLAAVNPITVDTTSGESQAFTSNQMVIGNVGGNDTIVASNGGPASFPLDPATGSVGPLKTNLANGEALEATVLGAQGVFFTFGGATSVSAQPFTVGSDGSLVAGSGSAFQASLGGNFQSPQIFRLGAQTLVGVTSQGSIGSSNVFLVPFSDPFGATATAQGLAAGTPQALTVVTPTPDSTGATTLVVAANNGSNITLTPFTTTGANNLTLGTAVTVDNAQVSLDTFGFVGITAAGNVSFFF